MCIRIFFLEYQDGKTVNRCFLLQYTYLIFTEIIISRSFLVNFTGFMGDFSEVCINSYTPQYFLISVILVISPASRRILTTSLSTSTTHNHY